MPVPTLVGTPDPEPYGGVMRAATSSGAAFVTISGGSVQQDPDDNVAAPELLPPRTVTRQDFCDFLRDAVGVDPGNVRSIVLGTHTGSVELYRLDSSGRRYMDPTNPHRAATYRLDLRVEGERWTP